MGGPTYYQLPAFAVRSADKENSLAYNQMIPITTENVVNMMAKWKTSSSSSKDRCMITKEMNREQDYTPERIEKYDKFAQAEKERIRLDEDEIREVNPDSYKKVIKKS